MTMRKFYLVITVLLLFSLSTNATDTDTLRLLVTNYPPWRMKIDNQYVGIDVEIWKEIAQKMGVVLKYYTSNSIQDIYDKILSGEVDAAVSMVKTKERESFMPFINPPVKVKRQMSFYVKKGNAYTIMQPNDLLGKRIGTGAPLIETLENHSDLKNIVTGDIGDLFELLKEDSLDAVMASDMGTDYYLSQSNLAHQFETAGYYYHVYNELHPTYYSLSKKSKYYERVDEIEEILSNLVNNGTVSAITNKYIPGYSKYFNFAKPEEEGMSSLKLSNIKKQAQDWVNQEQIMGAVMLVLRNDKIVFYETVGWNDKENKIPMRPDNVFRMGSMTKPITGTAILMLMEEGKLLLNDKVSKYIPSFNNSKCKDITIFQLLTHTSGIEDNDFYETYKKHSCLKEAVDALAQIGPKVKPGTEFIYSNEGISVLGAIIENITGKPVEKYIQERILIPLGMNISFCNLNPNDTNKSSIAACYIKDSIKWKKSWDNSMEMPMPYFTAATEFYSTALDYARFLNMMLHKGAFQGQQILSPSSVSLATTPHSTYVYDNESLRKEQVDYLGRYYGLTWWVYSDKYMSLRLPFSLGTFEIQGALGTCAFVDPKENLIGVILTQSARSWGVYWPIFPNMIYGALINGQN
jgi:CubicO group peptidase (beta-lactamase class C family)/ABC-type amino acid transport substrate-binding protein